MLNWREIPFIRLLLPLNVGILVAIVYPISFGNVLFFFAFLSLALSKKIARLYQHRWWSGIFISVALFFLGHQLALYTADQQHPFHFKSRLEQENTFVGIITQMPKVKNHVQLQVDIQQIELDSQWHPVHGQLLLYIPLDTLVGSFAYGDQLLFRARVKRIPTRSNPNAFDIQSYYHFQNIHYQGYGLAWRKIATGQANPIMQWAMQVRSHFLHTLKKYLYTPNELAVGSALILGHRDALSDELRDAYTGVGAMHVLAVSGLHVGFIFLLVSFFLKRIKIYHRYWRWLKLGLLLGAIWTFTLLTGASASVCRAATMFSFIAIANTSKRSYNIYNIIAFSAFVLLCYNPFFLVNVGFQLSYLAVTGIIFLQPKIYPLWIINNPIGDYIWKLTSVSIAAQIATFPISLYYFHQFPTYFLLSGLIVVPAAVFILSGGLLLFASSFISSGIASGMGSLLYGLIWLVNAGIFGIYQLPYSLTTGIWISGLSTLLLYAFFSCLTIAFYQKRLRFIQVALVILLLFSVKRTWAHYQSFQKAELVIYDIYKHSLVDFISQQERFTLKDSLLSEDKFNYAAQNHHWANFIQKDSTTTFASAKNRLLHFHGKTLFIADELPDSAALNASPFDYVLLRKNTKIDLTQLIQRHSIQTIIIDSSSYKSQVEKWIALCQQRQIPYHYTAEMGAYVAQF